MKIIIIIVVVLLIGVTAIFTYSGLFNSVSIQEKDTGPYILVYEEHTGNYLTSMTIQRKVYRSLQKEFGITSRIGFGIHYEDPRNLKLKNLHSEIGCILDKQNELKINDIKKKFKVKIFPVTKSLVVELPFRNLLSIILGTMKAYPELEKYIKLNKYTKPYSMEIYDNPARKIRYIVPIVTD